MKRLSNWELVGTVTYAASILFAILIALSFSGCNDGCGFGSGSCIGIDEPQEEPTCAELVTDECVGEVIAEFCPEDRYAEGYRDGFTAAQEQDTHECPEPDVVEPSDDGYCDLSVPVGHRPIECRGKDHAR